MALLDQLYRIVRDLIDTRREGNYWDFKQNHHINKADLIHDIICLANNRSGKDGYIIFGVLDNPKGEICGVEEDSNRRNQQQIIDLLQSHKLKWAYGVYPSVELNTIQLERHEVDVLVVKSTLDVPYFLTEDYSHTVEGSKPRVVRANYIYTRVCDTNTPIDRSAAPHQIEMLWRRRFGLDLLPLEQVKRKLLQRDDWDSYEDDDNGDTVYYNRFSPEYTIRTRSIDRPEYPPFYSYVQYNESTGFYMLYVMYHSTVLSKMEMVALDSGRYCTPSPDISFVRDKKDPLDPVYQYRYFLKDSIEYCVQQFLFDDENPEQIWARRRFDEVVLYFENQEKEAYFCIDLEYHPEILDSYLEKENEPHVFTGNERLNKQYANNIKVSRALKAFQKDWEAM